MSAPVSAKVSVQTEPEPAPVPAGQRRLPRYLAACAAAVVVWVTLYASLQPFAAWLTYQVIGLERGSHLASAAEFFVFESPKVLMLLVLVVFGVGIVRSFFTPERTRRILAGKREAVGNEFSAPVAHKISWPVPKRDEVRGWLNA
jgi:uncharacterized membrane protein YraQ (UPF0718 family)